MFAVSGQTVPLTFTGLSSLSIPAAAKGCLHCRLLCDLFSLTQVLEELHPSSVVGPMWIKQERACILMA